MNEKQQEERGPVALLAEWMKSSSEFWGSMARMWAGGNGAPDASTPPKKGIERGAHEQWQSLLKTWESLASAMGEPGALDSIYKGINALPETMLRMVRVSWDGYFQLQQQWLERLGRIGKSTEAYKFESLDQDAFKAWTEIYENEFKQFLNIPPLGLARFYQERMGRFADKLNMFHGAMAEFMYVLFLPMEKTFKIVQEELEETKQEGKLPENSQEYYKMWLKILEGLYMTLFKSSEYNQTLSNTLNAAFTSSSSTA